MPEVLETRSVDVTVCLLAKYRLQQVDSIVQGLCACLDQRDLGYEILLVANGLTDENKAHLMRFAQGALPANPHVKIFRFRRSLENAACIKAIERKIRGRFVLSLESGGNFEAADIDRVLDRLWEGYDFVNTVRDWRGEPVVNMWQSSLFNWATRLVTGTGVHDLNSTLKGFRREVLEDVALYGDFYRFLPILAERKGFRVSDLPVKRREEQTVRTIYGPVSYLRRALDLLNLIFITRFTEKPLRFFGGFGAAVMLAGIVINVILTVQRFAFGEGMADRPMLLLGILLIVVGVQAISLGLLGEMVVYARTKDFKTYEVEEVL